MTEAVVTFATCNTPQGHKDKIPHTARARVIYLADLLNRLGIQAVGLQETGPLLARWWRRRALWRYIGGPAITLGGGGRRTGNGAAIRIAGGRPLEVVHRRAVRIPVNWRRNLHIPAILRPRAAFMAILLRDPETGVLFVLLVIHLPILAYLQSAAERLRINGELIAYAKRLRAMNLPVIPLGDFNAGKSSPEIRAWLRNGFVYGTGVGADHILGGGVVFTDGGADTSVHGTVTDHTAMPYATAHMAVPAKPVIVRALPKV